MKVYNGEAKEFQSWFFQVRMRLTEHAGVYAHVFTWIKQLKQSPDQRAFEDLVMDPNNPADPTEFGKACKELWGVLHKKTGDKVDTIIHNHETEDVHLRGPMVLYRLIQDAQGMTGHRATKLTELILQPKPVPLTTLQDRFERWEAHVRELMTDGDTSLPDCALATGLKAMLPTDMQKFLADNPDRYTTTEEINTYIRSTLSLRREHFFAGVSNPGPGAGKAAVKQPRDEDVPMPQAHQVTPHSACGTLPEGSHEEADDNQEEHDLNAVWRINGTCHRCGAWGHMQRDCHKFNNGGDKGGKNGEKGGKGKKGKSDGKGNGSPGKGWSSSGVGP